jgi:prolipoprotein diacylglyceryltransferase
MRNVGLVVGFFTMGQVMSVCLVLVGTALLFARGKR